MYFPFLLYPALPPFFISCAGVGEGAEGSGAPPKTKMEEYDMLVPFYLFVSFSNLDFHSEVGHNFLLSFSFILFFSS